MKTFYLIDAIETQLLRVTAYHHGFAKKMMVHYHIMKAKEDNVVRIVEEKDAATHHGLGWETVGKAQVEVKGGVCILYSFAWTGKPPWLE